MTTQLTRPIPIPADNTPPVPPPKKTKRRWLIPAVVGVVAFGVGGGIGAAAGGETPAATVITKTITVPGPTVYKDRVVTKDRIVTRNDAQLINAGRQAMNAAEDVVGLATQIIGYAGDAFIAVGAGDVETLALKQQQIQNVTPKIEPAVTRYNEAKARFEALAGK